MTSIYKYTSIRLPLLIVLILCSLFLIIPDFFINFPFQEKLSGIILFIIINAFLVNRLKKILNNPKELIIKDDKVIFKYYNNSEKKVSADDIERFEYIGESRLLRRIRNLNIFLKDAEIVTIFYSISNYEQLIEKLSSITGFHPDSKIE